MAEYGYLIYSSTSRRDEEAIKAVFAAVPCENVVLEQLWFPGEKRRPALEALLTKLQPGDTLYVHGIDRLGNDAKEAVRVWRKVTLTKQANIVLLDDPGLDTRICPKPTLAILKDVVQKAFDRAELLLKNYNRLYTEFELVKVNPAQESAISGQAVSDECAISMGVT